MLPSTLFVLPLCSLEDSLVLAFTFWALAVLNEKQHELNADWETVYSGCSLCHTWPLTSSFSDPLIYVSSVILFQLSIHHMLMWCSTHISFIYQLLLQELGAVVVIFWIWQLKN